MREGLASAGSFFVVEGVRFGGWSGETLREKSNLSQPKNPPKQAAGVREDKRSD